MEQKDRANRQFFIGVIANERFKELALEVLPALEDRLNEQVDLRTYTDQIEKLFFTPILDLGAEEIEEWKYDEPVRKLSLKKTIPVDEIVPTIDEGEFLTLISTTFLELAESIEIVPDDLIRRFRKVLGISEL